MALMTDRAGRHFPYLRLSLLEACQFHCSYCLPNGYRAGAERPASLMPDEIARLLRAFAAVGMSKLRLTGGEPTLRRDLIEVIEVAAATPGLKKIAMTTNGCLVKRSVSDWRAAGLTSLNISIDALDRQRFAEITGHDRLDLILEGLEVALGVGLDAVKINAVLLRDLNDDQLPAFLEFVRDRAVSVRFIELMQTGSNLDYFRRHHQRAAVLEAQLLASGWQMIARAADAGPAQEYTHPDYRGRIGIIAPYARDFCASCNRLRVTASGDLRLCLFGNVGIPLRPMLQDDASADELQATLISQLGLKALGHRLHEGETGLVPHLASIGG